MSLLEDLAGGPPRPDKGPVCGAGRMAQELSPEEVAALMSALDRGWTVKQVAELLHANGHEVGYYTLSRHFRQRTCKCWQTS